MFLAMRRLVATAMMGCLSAGAMAAQEAPDRADPAVVEQELARPEQGVASSQPVGPVQVETATEVDLSGTIVAGAIRIEGATELSPAMFAPVIERYVGRPLSRDDLAALASEIANVARAQGYGLAGAWIPAQRVGDGILNVRLDEGRIDAVEARGEAAAVAGRYLGMLATGRPVRTAELERQLLLTGDVAGVWAGRARLERKGGTNVLIVETRFERVEGYATLDNWGSDTVGPIQAQAVIDVNRVVTGADSVRLGAAVTPFQPREFWLVRAGYLTQLGMQGTEIAIEGYYAESQPGASLRTRDYDGRSLQGEVELSHPLVRTRSKSLWGYLSLAVRDSAQWRQNARTRDDRIAKVQASSYGLARFDGGRVRGRLTVSQGLDILGATDSGDRLASRVDADGVFSTAEYWIELTKNVSKGVSVQFASEGQIASGPLLSAEEMGLGGRYFLRGYDYREFSGDRGIAGSAEIRFDLAKLPKPLREAQLYAYVDAGSVGDLRNGGGGGSLASAGGGIRLRLGRTLQGGLEIGVPLAEGYRGADRDPRVSFTLSAGF